MALTNPALNSRVFQRSIDEDGPGWATPDGRGTAVEARPAPAPAGLDFGGERLHGPVTAAPGRPMTLGGTFTATLVLFMALLATGWYGWNAVKQTTELVFDPSVGENVTRSTTAMPGWLLPALLVGLGLAIVTIMKPQLARFTGVLYAAAEGLVLGAISAVYNIQYSGIVVQALLATASVFAVMLFLYGTRIVKVTPRFTRIILGAMMGILVLYLGSMVASLFGVTLDFYNKPTPLGIGISLLIVGVASFRLMLNFDFIESAVENRAPRYMEWYAAFGLVLSLLWLYLEILRLMALLRQR